MDGGVVVRRADAADAIELRALQARSSDSGKVAFRPRYKASAEELAQAQSGAMVGFVAVAAGRLVGTARVTFSRVDVGGRAVELAWLHSLSVEPAWRRRGIARHLTRARLAEIDARPGPVVVGAAVQEGNAASMANAMRWADRVLGLVRVTPVPVPRRPPRPSAEVSVRAATTADLPAVAAGIRDTAATLLLSPTPDAEELESWLAVSIGGEPLRRLVLAIDRDGRVVAGIGIEDESALLSLEVTRMPLAIAAANVLVRVVPKDRLMRNLNVRHPWFRAGHEAAARALWRQVRWDLRHHGSSIVRAVDPTGPFAAALPAARWLPSTSLRVVVREPPGLTWPTLPLGVVV